MIKQGEPTCRPVVDNSRFTEEAACEDDGEGVVQAGGDCRTHKDETEDNLKVEFKMADMFSTTKADTTD